MSSAGGMRSPPTNTSTTAMASTGTGLLIPTLPAALVWGLLLISLISTFAFPRVWPYLLGACLLAATGLGFLTAPGLLFLLVFYALALAGRHSVGPRQYALITAVLLAALALCSHLLPGFSSLLVLDQVSSGPLSLPYTLRMNLDKPLLVFGLLILLPTLLLRQRADYDGRQLVIAALLLVGLQLLALALGMVKVEWSLPYWVGVFALSNLLLTCFAEEALFRGGIQHYLCRWLGIWPGLLLASAIFGVAHYNNGPLYIVFAAIAGFAYGLSYQASGRLWVAILFHFGFNLSHLLWLTYPLARP